MSEALFVPRRWRRVAPVVMSSLILIGAGTQLPALSVFAVDAPVPTAVRCGQVLDTSVLVTNDLSDCPADGLIIGAPGITVALDGHTIDGVGLGTGVLNDGHRGVTVTGGTLREFDVGVLLNPGTADNVASHLDVELNQEAGIRLSGAHSGNLIHSNTFVGNALAVGLVDGTEGAIVRDNAVPDGSGHGLEIIASHGNRLEGNAVTGGSDAGIVLEGSRRNVLVGNQVSGVSDAAVLVHTESDGNRIEGNTVTASDGGVVVAESSGNLVIGNAIHDMSDSGVDLDAAHRTVVLDNDLRFNGEGIEVFDSTGNRLESNDTSQSTGTAISIEGASTGNAVLRNIADDNGSNGIAVIALATPGEGNVLSGNRASRNQGAGISVSSAGHSIGSNVADDNGGWGIYAVSGNLDAGGNMASGNGEPSQCSGVVCDGVGPVPDVDPAGTEITDRPLNPSAVRYATFAFTTDDEDVATRFECSLDDAPFEPCTSPSEYSGLDLGWHTFAVRSIDVAGNVDPTPAAYIWVIEAAPPVDCGSTVVATADADAWIDQNSTTANKGDDSALKVRSKGPSDNFRTLVRLPLPAMPDGCAVDTATLSLYSSGAAASRTLHALSIAAAWSENTVTWSNQPRTTGLPAATPAGEGFRHWNVKSQVQEMYDTGVSHGFLIRDATEGADAEQSFSTREDEEGAPRLALRFMAVLPTDTTAPNTSIGTGPEASTTATTAGFSFTADEDAATFTCALDGQDYTECTSPATYTGLSQGTHLFSVHATDPAGNTDPTPATWTWTITTPEPEPDTTPPNTSIGTGPEASTTATTAGFSFTADEDAATFTCALDGQDYTECTSPATYTGLSQGTHLFSVHATDPAGNTDPTPATWTWTITTPEPEPDTTPPNTSIGTGPEASTTATTAGFSFTADEDAATFTCALDGQDHTDCTSPATYTGLSQGTHLFSVHATDPAGNTDPTPATWTWTITTPEPEPDTTPPNTSIGTGPEASTTATTAEFSFTADEDAATFTCALDGQDHTDCTSPATYTGLSQGTHLFSVHATDPAGNTDPTPATWTWTITTPEPEPDTTPPNTSIGTGPEASTTATTAGFSFTADEDAATFTCALDGQDHTDCTSPATYTGLSQGTHLFSVHATDPAGNTDPTPATWTWTITTPEPEPDTTPPNTSIGTGPEASTTATTAGFSFTADEDAATFTCALDGQDHTDCTSPATYTGLSQGTHLFSVHATDPAGNTDPTPATWAWTITTPEPEPDCGAPVTALTSADAWLDENSATANKGDDAILKVQSKGPRDNFRALVRFALPPLPPGCAIESATLRLYAASSTPGRSIEVVRVTGAWTETGVNWANQPTTTGPAATTPSAAGYREWTVATHVQSMYDSGANLGFLIRDAVEGADAEQQFHGREKGESPPQLVLRFTRR